MPRRNSGKLVSLGLIALLGVMAAGVFINTRRPAASAEIRPAVGYAAPPLVFTDEQGRGRPVVDLNGKPVRLEDYRGKVVFLNFWATWCPPCKREMPDIQRVHERYGNRVKVLAVNATDQDDETGAREFVRRFRLTFDVPLDRTGEVTEAYQVMFFPSTFVIDGKGIIRDRVEGAMNYSLMESSIRKAGR